MQPPILFPINDNQENDNQQPKQTPAPAMFPIAPSQLPVFPKDKKEGCYMLFDGESLKLFDNENNQIFKANAYSGKPINIEQEDITEESLPDDVYMNNPKYQNVKNKGPTPEGDYQLNFLQQHFKTNNKFSKQIMTRFFNRFTGNEDAWGPYRIGLIPSETTNTYGRDEMFLHGGKYAGSAGCIDIVNDMQNLVDFAKLNKIDLNGIPLKVKYGKSFKSNKKQ